VIVVVVDAVGMDKHEQALETAKLVVERELEA
jgi:hypothetical protein